MLHRIARLFEPLLRRPVSPPGRHRLRTATAGPAGPAAPAAVPTPPAAPPRVPVPPLRGEDMALVRPYVVALEHDREEARRQRARRRALWLATHGIDVDHRVVHGVQAAA